ncbi:MAG: hypothetical protein J6Z01_10970 [Bacteroidales bacterium]|nr:hypothetical protein [Bacteroidales bacterium]
MATATLNTDYNVAEGYFKMLNPLSDSIKIFLLKMIANSLEPRQTTEKTEKVSSLKNLFGVWANSPDTDGIEDFIKNSRTNSGLRQTVSFN